MSAGHVARFYIEILPSEGTVPLSREQARHAKALRIREGNVLELFDGKHEYTAKYHENGTAVILAKSESKGVSGVQITLAVAFPKGSRADWLVEKATELGAHAIIPLLTQRTVVEPRDTKVERLQKLAITACEQSGRTTLPSIKAPQTLADVLRSANAFDTRIIADAVGTPLTTASPHGKNVLVLIGPEGGFTDEELTQAAAAGCATTSLARTTLRTETAAIAALSILNGTSA
jgi:16S rRNA (uracil1498-N3)-methyltransferase